MLRYRLLAWFLSVAMPVSALGQQSIEEDEAGDVSELEKIRSGPLRDRIRPVSGHLFLMDGRFEISPALGVSFRDAFWTKFAFGGTLTYHMTETMALSLHGGYMLAVIAPSSQICTPVQPANAETGTPVIPGDCRPPQYEELTQQDGMPANKAYGLTKVVGSIDFQWAPIYGKLSLFAAKTLSFNMYALLGPVFVMYGPEDTPTAGGNLGVGFRFFINQWMTIRTELRDTVYFEKGYLPPTAPAGAAEGSLRNQLTFELGLSMFFPTVFGEEG